MPFDSSEEHDICVETDGNGFSGSDGDHRAYENTEDSPTIEFYIEDGKIIKAW